ncbi:MAG: 23S rRNA (guanosine(2251)-2'-O)-methyltransferase RlmB [Coriobacteriales bacterium]|nr:23S rRNA (guanosine(2251)-2'-O)-methyltransferase RlmB [Coriobacteriales bacterium]
MGSSKSKNKYYKQKRKNNHFDTNISKNNIGPQVSNGIIIEGKHALVEALKSDANIQIIYASDNFLRNNSIIFEEILQKKIKVENASIEYLHELADNKSHQGVIAKLSNYQYHTLESIIEKASSKQNSLILALDHITDSGNFGAICRSAEVAGATCVIIENDRSVGVTSVTYKTSAGALFYLPIVRVVNLSRALNELKQNNYFVYGASEKAKLKIWDANFANRSVIVLGNEEKGLTSLTEKSCDELVTIPQKGSIESLNVSNAASILCFEFLRQTSLGL